MKKLLTFLLSIMSTSGFAVINSKDHYYNFNKEIPIIKSKENLTASVDNQMTMSEIDPGIDGTLLTTNVINLTSTAENANEKIKTDTLSGDFGDLSNLTPYYEYFYCGRLDFDIYPQLSLWSVNVDSDLDRKIHIHFDTNQVTTTVFSKAIFLFKEANVAIATSIKITITRNNLTKKFNISGDIQYEVNPNLKVWWENGYSYGSLNFKVINARVEVNSIKYATNKLKNDNSYKEWIKLTNEKINTLKLIRGMTPATSFSDTYFYGSDEATKEIILNIDGYLKNIFETGEGHINNFSQAHLDNKDDDFLNTIAYGDNKTFDNNPMTQKIFRFNMLDGNNLNFERLRVVEFPSINNYTKYIDSIINGGLSDRRFKTSLNIEDNPGLSQIANKTLKEGINSFDVKMTITDTKNNFSKILIVTNFNSGPGGNWMWSPDTDTSLFNIDMPIEFTFTLFPNQTSPFVVTKTSNDDEFIVKSNPTAIIDSIIFPTTIYFDKSKCSFFLMAKDLKNVEGLQFDCDWVEKSRFINDNLIEIKPNDKFRKSATVEISAMNLKTSIKLTFVMPDDLNYNEVNNIFNIKNEIKTKIGDWNKINISNVQMYELSTIDNDKSIDTISKDDAFYFRVRHIINKQFEFVSKYANYGFSLIANVEKNNKVPKLDHKLCDFNLSTSNTVKISNWASFAKINVINLNETDYSITLNNNLISIAPKNGSNLNYRPEMKFKISADGNDYVFSSNDLTANYYDATNYDLPEELRNKNDGNPNNNLPDQPNNDNGSTIVNKKESHNNVGWIISTSLLTAFGVGWFIWSLIIIKKLQNKLKS